MQIHLNQNFYMAKILGMFLLLVTLGVLRSKSLDQILTQRRLIR